VTENQIATQILDAAFAIHTKLDPGLLESLYEVVLAYELQKRGLTSERQKAMPILYDNIRFDEAFRSDLVVNGKVIAEFKSRHCSRCTGSIFSHNYGSAVSSWAFSLISAKRI
jgi:GxxExxY protein